MTTVERKTLLMVQSVAGAIACLIDDGGPSLRQILDAIETAVIETYARRGTWSNASLAQRLGMHRSTLRERFKLIRGGLRR